MLLIFIEIELLYIYIFFFSIISIERIKSKFLSQQFIIFIDELFYFQLKLANFLQIFSLPFSLEIEKFEKIIYLTILVFILNYFSDENRSIRFNSIQLIINNLRYRKRNSFTRNFDCYHLFCH